MTRFQRLALATTVATYILVVIGGTVRATGSGLACPDWPTCNGSVIPAFQEHVLIEYSHRLFASLVSVLVIASAAVAWRSYRRDRGIVTLASLAVGVLIAQVLLGAVTVRADLPASVVTAHLGTAMLLFAMVALLTLVSFQRTRPIVRPMRANRAHARAFCTAAFVAAAGMYVLLLSGAYTASSGAGGACSTWPLCNGRLFPHGSRPVDIHVAHRLIVVAVSIALVVLVVGAYRWLPGQDTVKREVRNTLALFVAQVFFGALNVWTSLATGVRILHLATGAALWVALVTITWMAYMLTQREPAVAIEGAPRSVQSGVRSSREVAG